MVSIAEKFKRYAAETKLHGIARLIEAKNVSMAFWAVLTFVSVCMAISDLIRLVSQFQSAPTAMQISLTNNNSLSWPTPTLCMEMLVQYADSYSASGQGNSVVTINPDVPDLGLVTYDTVEPTFEQFYSLADSDNYTAVDYYIGRDNSAVMYFTYMMLGYLSELEAKLVGQQQSYLKDYQFNLAYNYDYNDNYTVFAQKFYQYYKGRQPPISITKLSKVMGMWFCLQQLTGLPGITSEFLKTPLPTIYGQFENYRYFGDPNYISLPMCKAKMITHLGFSLVCSKLFETPNVPFVRDYLYFAIYNTHMSQILHMKQQFNGTWANDVKSAMLIPNFKWHLDVEGRDVLPLENDRQNVFSWSPSEHVVVDISVAREFQFLNSQAQRCSNAIKSQQQCQRRQQLQFVYQQCGCWPSLIDLSNKVEDVVYCSDFHYFDQTFPTTTKIYNLTTAMLPCGGSLNQLNTSSCLPDCHVVENKFAPQPKKKFFLERTWSNSDPMQKTGSLEFRYTSNPHPFIEEISTLQWSSFLGTWGGSIGTWLGASLMAFLHIPIFLLRHF